MCVKCSIQERRKKERMEEEQRLAELRAADEARRKAEEVGTSTSPSVYFLTI